MKKHSGFLNGITNVELKLAVEKSFADAHAFFTKLTPNKKYEILRPLNQYIDQTLLKPEATAGDIEKLCVAAKTHSFKAVCIQPHFLSHAIESLRGCRVLPITVIGFPLGVNTTSTKIYEAQIVAILGAKEIDMVMNISAMKSGDYDFVYQDIKEVVLAAKDVPVKVIIETAYLSDEEKVIACACVQLAGAKFIKTSTGFAPTHARIEDIQLFKYLLGDKVKIKASGGIKTREQARAFLEAGADRLGTSSGVEIFTGATTTSKGGY